MGASMSAFRTHTARRGIDWAIILIVGILAIGMLLPFLWLFSMSFRPVSQAYQLPPSFLPPSLDPANYKAVLASRIPFLHIYANSLLIAGLVTVGQLVTCTLAAFAFARLRFRVATTLFFILLVGLMFPAQVTILPIYLGYARVGLTNQPIGLALMYLTSSFGVFLMRQFMLSQPKALEEAALMDGAGYFKIFRRISLPQLRPGAVGARHHHLHPDLELLFPGPHPARPRGVHDAARRHGRAARLPRLGKPQPRHGGDEHVGAAGRSALPLRPEVRDRRHHDERHQELISKDKNNNVG